MTATSENFAEIPVIDLGPWLQGTPEDRATFAEEVSRICHEVGFFVLTGHGVDHQLFDDVFTMMEQFFALPDEVKASIDKQNSPHFRGWEQVGSESTNNRPDIREQVDIWSEMEAYPAGIEPPYRRLIGPNQWLDNSALPGHRELTERWAAALRGVADELLDVLSLGLGLREDHFATLFGKDSMSLLKLIHYPPTPPGGAGVNGHHDTGFVTVLAAGATPGLEVQAPDGSWIDVPALDHSFVINLGEMLQALTGNYFVATPHRVVAGQERYSSGFFHGPGVDTPLEALDLEPSYAAAVAASARHASAGFMAPVAELEAGAGDMESAFQAATWGEQVWNYFVRSYPDIVRMHHPELME